MPGCSTPHSESLDATLHWASTGMQGLERSTGCTSQHLESSLYPHSSSHAFEPLEKREAPSAPCRGNSTPAMDDITFVTGNKNKLAEVNQILGPSIVLRSQSLDRTLYTLPWSTPSCVCLGDGILTV